MDDGESVKKIMYDNYGEMHDARVVLLKASPAPLPSPNSPPSIVMVPNVENCSTVEAFISLFSVSKSHTAHILLLGLKSVGGLIGCSCSNTCGMWKHFCFMFSLDGGGGGGATG